MAGGMSGPAFWAEARRGREVPLLDRTGGYIGRLYLSREEGFDLAVSVAHLDPGQGSRWGLQLIEQDLAVERECRAMTRAVEAAGGLVEA